MAQLAGKTFKLGDVVLSKYCGTSCYYWSRIAKLYTGSCGQQLCDIDWLRPHASIVCGHKARAYACNDEREDLENNIGLNLKEAVRRPISSDLDATAPAGLTVQSKAACLEDLLGDLILEGQETQQAQQPQQAAHQQETCAHVLPMDPAIGSSSLVAALSFPGSASNNSMRTTCDIEQSWPAPVQAQSVCQAFCPAEAANLASKMPALSMPSTVVQHQKAVSAATQKPEQRVPFLPQQGTGTVPASTSARSNTDNGYSTSAGKTPSSPRTLGVFASAAEVSRLQFLNGLADLSFGEPKSAPTLQSKNVASGNTQLKPEKCSGAFDFVSDLLGHELKDSAVTTAPQSLQTWR
eukprot:TRINITY_DN4512_c0_g1_i1.p1 TRINITY_DN4512_c0_g1~~TRINITY_DN4512_c0_g1_i1.p1  ORF type:complete len:351 (-),score=70.35 TRINITY_DN4512_c0_g1_i1:482-1534(-)